MARLWIFSDIHAEFRRGKAPIRGLTPPERADIAVIAGDVDHARHAVATTRRLVGPRLPIIMVAGNHEHYGALQTVPRGISLMKQAAALEDGNTFVLENDVVEIPVRGEGVRFIGSTLWVDFRLFGEPGRHAEYGRRGLSDFSEIISEDPSLFAIRPVDMMRWFSASRAFIKRELGRRHDGPTVVVTHHCPSIRSVAQRYLKDPMTPCFASNCDDLLDLGADLWVHGHTHDSFDYQASRTRVICNPHGYVSGGKLENRSFNPALAVDVGQSP
ncbi:MAG: metallophosphoesterase [Rhodospirillales bacterium]|nr:metallophosphoesterase [Rhodospirillales bacterium]